MTDRQPDMTAITAALRPALRGGTRNIYIWDGDHTDPTATRITNSPEMFRLMREFGTPVYIIEDADGMLLPAMQYFSTLPPAERAREIQRGISSLPAEQRATFRANATLFDRVLNDGASLIAPDPRAQMMDFSDAELAMYQRLMALSSTGNTMPTDAQVQAFARSLSAGERAVANSVVTKVNAIITNIDELDAAINTRIGTELRGLRADGITNPVTITQYGAGHFYKNQDLDERAPGVSIAVVPRPGYLGRYYRSSGMPDTARDLPEYAYYSETGRLSRLNTGEAMLEFTGRSDGREIDRIIPYFQNVMQADPRFHAFFDRDGNGILNLYEISDKLAQLGITTVAQVNPNRDEIVTQAEFFSAISAAITRQR